MEEYYPHIRKNYAGISHDLVQGAVTNFDGTLTLHTEKKTRGDEISHSYIVHKETNTSWTVDAVMLDTYFSRTSARKPYLLKVDVEGADVPSQILQGARNTLEDCAVVMIEMTVDKFMERGRILDDLGFDLWDLADIC